MTTLHIASCGSIVLGALLACGLHTETTPLNASPRSLIFRSPESVAVLTSPPPQEHVAVALIEVEPETSLGREETQALLAKARSRAAELGCDALLVHGVDNRGPGADAILFDKSYDRKGMVTSCIVYKPVQSAPAAAVGLNATQ